ncbi:MAG: TRAP transporter large permease subunit, partial [Alphaproteobacteria bacterium]
MEATRFRRLPPIWWGILLAATFGAILLSIYMIFNLGIYFGYVPLEAEYFYALLGLLLPLAFLLYPPWKGVGPMDRVPWYDALLALATVAIAGYFIHHSIEIIESGWEYFAPPTATWLSYAMWLLVLEATRRAGGMAIFSICVIVSIYPVYADIAPGFLSGQSSSWAMTGNFHLFGGESVLGIPMRAFAWLVVGFLVFGVALQHTGGGAFFLNLAFALLGKWRGGPAKVAIFSSGLMGSMSGSVITNVLTTGVMTIPAMKRVGFRPAFAGGVEACASTGGVLMPPIMGATAFVMATFLEIPYATIVVAAI